MKFYIEIYQASSGRKPFDLWFKKLKDSKIKALILSKIDGIKLGNLSDVKSVGGGVNEIRIHTGPGYRIYFAKSGLKIILLLCGGAKDTQEKDISNAKKYYSDYKTQKESK